ncbi:MAG TPA: reverse transcriptase family protein [Candidatus Acidoferrales bacterium]|nr:reverse transcriptase family protein [Candidatus Acidoferrales bacterium]
MKSPLPTGETVVLPPLVSFSSADDFKRALQSEGRSPLDDEALVAFDRLQRSGLPPLVSPTALGVLLGVSPKLVTAMGLFPDRYYREFKVPKRRGGTRTILAPRTYLKAVQRYVLKRILETRPLPPNVTGFVRGRSIVTNASYHAKARYLLNVDLKDFFGSVHKKQVRRVFAGLGYSGRMSEVLGRLCTYRDSLPQGAPCSPYLANLCFLETDAAIQRLCDRLSVTYSRYADDLTFSRQKPFPGGFLDSVRFLVKRAGFDLNKKKTRFSGPGQRNLVTGLVVNAKVQPPRILRRKLRAMFHQAEARPGRPKHSGPELLGWASFVKTYSHALGSKYMKVAKSNPANWPAR